MKRVAAIILLCVLLYTSFSSWEDKTSTRSHIYTPYVEVRISEYTEYQDFISDATYLPEGFITADMLKGFGAFQAFGTYGGIYPAIKRYHYVFVAGNDLVLQVTIPHIEGDRKSERQTFLPQSCVGGSMLYLKERLTGSVSRNGIMYFYINGQLGDICWTANNGITLNVGPFSYREKYLELPEDSLICRLLSASEEEQFSAAEELLSIGTQ